MSYTVMLSPFIGALIGWFTNVIAIKLIFRPHKPIGIPLLGISIQGLIPKRKGEIARSLGEIVERELFSMDDLIFTITCDEAKDRIIQLSGRKLRETILKRLPGLIPAYVKETAATVLEDIFRREAPQLFSELAGEIGREINEKISIAVIIEEKINAMDWTGLEKLVLEVAFRELRHIELLGAVIGFFIGLSQLALALLF
ncbi:MAG: DUF445 family protein [Clostridia bacterium]|jgi:uncharacterized membrane protein YheB (UPF0754 family)|nr:DUF445 family protein [Clostridia bacterium]